MHIYFKRMQIGPYERWMLALVAVATLARFLLIYFNWPITNSDEANMGLVAFHIAYQGDHPTFFYGLPYMGPLEGYIAAPLFRIFGPSLFTLRCALLPLFAAFLVSMYYLTRLLYNEKFALAIVVLLSLGSSEVILLQIRAFGEYPETELFAALIPLIASWLALSAYSLNQEGIEARRVKRKRVMIYGFLGIIIGIALWVDFLILPFVAAAGLLLLLFCRRELLSWAGLSLLLGVFIGAFPLILYNLTAPQDQNSLSTLLWIHRAGAKEIAALHLSWLHHIVGTIMISLPSVTGADPSCPVQSFPLFGSPSPSLLPCILFHGGWGFGYLILWIIASLLAARVVWQYRRHFIAQKDFSEDRQCLIYQCCRLMLLVSAGMTLILYATSPTSAVPPIISYRYLIGMLIAAPAILWPLWNGLGSKNIRSGWKTKGYLLLRGGLLFLILCTFLSGTVRTFADIPGAQAAYQQEDTLIQNLLNIGVTRIYSEYWTCNRLTFHSQEQIICSVLDEQLRPGFDRYMPYRFVVRADPHPAYVFPLGSKQEDILKRQMLASDVHYRQYIFEGYAVYQVIS